MAADFKKTDALAYELELEAGHDEAIELVTSALAGGGFGVLTRIDVHDVFKTKLDVDFRPYSILGACNPRMAQQALEARSDVGLLLPCNVVVEQTGPGRSLVRIGKPTTLMGVGDLPTDLKMSSVASEVAGMLESVARSLGSGGRPA